VLDEGENLLVGACGGEHEDVLTDNDRPGAAPPACHQQLYGMRQDTESLNAQLDAPSTVNDSPPGASTTRPPSSPRHHRRERLGRTCLEEPHPKPGTTTAAQRRRLTQQPVPTRRPRLAAAYEAETDASACLERRSSRPQAPPRQVDSPSPGRYGRQRDVPPVFHSQVRTSRPRSSGDRATVS
jgi:hypothetical protein